MNAPQKITPTRTPQDADRIMALVGELDVVAHTLEQKWGVGRLPWLAGVELGQRFYSQARKLRVALEHGSPADVDVEAGRMRLAWVTLDQVATQAHGNPPPTPDVWEFVAKVPHMGRPDMPMEDYVIKLTKTTEEAHKLVQALQVSKPPVNTQVWSLEEIKNLIEGFPELVRTKNVFPAMQVESVRTRLPINWAAGDDLPETMGGTPREDTIGF